MALSMHRFKRALGFFFAVSLVMVPAACDDGDAEADTQGDHHAEGGDPDTSVMWVDEPPAGVAASEPVTASFMVDTTGELHVAELRACAGAAITDCGLGDMDSFMSAPAVAVEGDHHMYMGELTLEAGDWTVVAYAHVGPDPHVSDPIHVTVQ
jgi:hypothetical protein